MAIFHKSQNFHIFSLSKQHTPTTNNDLQHITIFLSYPNLPVYIQIIIGYKRINQLNWNGLHYLNFLKLIKIVNSIYQKEFTTYNNKYTTYLNRSDSLLHYIQSLRSPNSLIEFLQKFLFENLLLFYRRRRYKVIYSTRIIKNWIQSRVIIFESI